MGERTLPKFATVSIRVIKLVTISTLLVGCGAYLLDEPQEYEKKLKSKFEIGTSVKDLEEHLRKQGFRRKKTSTTSTKDCFGKTFHAFPAATIWRHVCVGADQEQKISDIKVIQYGAGL